MRPRTCITDFSACDVPDQTRPTVKTKIEQRLELFIKYAKAQVRREFPEFDFGERMSLDGAAMLLT